MQTPGVDGESDISAQQFSARSRAGRPQTGTQLMPTRNIAPTQTASFTHIGNVGRSLGSTTWGSSVELSGQPYPFSQAGLLTA